MRREGSWFRARGFAPALGAMVLALVAGACGGAPTPTATSPAAVPTSSATGSSSAGQIWLAGLQVSETPEALDTATTELASVLGGALVVAPVACFDGLPGVAGTGYLLGAGAESEARAEELAARTQIQPLFVVATHSVCVD